MLTRRNFLKGLLTTIATTAITRNGVLRPSEELEMPKRTVFDMAQNTWREQLSDVVSIFAPCDGSVTRFTSDCGDLVFPRMIGGIVQFIGEGQCQPIGIVISMARMANGRNEYLVKFNTPERFAIGWRWSGMG